MNIDQISAGFDVPDNIHVVVEIPAYSGQVKYELDKKSGALFVDRFMKTSMHYPCNYGFIPKTLAEDGDPVDVLVVTQTPLIHGAVICCRPIGMLAMADEKGKDAKIIAVPTTDLSKEYDHVKSLADLPSSLLAAIWHFFSYYKSLEPDKEVVIENWQDLEVAKKEIIASVQRFNDDQL